MKESNYFGKKELRFARFYKSKASELLIDAVPTLALQIEELTPIIIIPRKTCLDTLSKHSMCSVSLESNLCYQNQSLRIHNTVLTDSGSSPFFNRFFNVQQDFSEHGYVSFPSLDLYSQDKRSSSIYN